MQARQFFVLAVLMACAAVLTAIVPKRALFNTPGGTSVLAGMSAFATLTGFFLRWRTAGAVEANHAQIDSRCEHQSRPHSYFK